MKTFLAGVQKFALIVIKKIQNIKTVKPSPIVLTYTLYGDSKKTKFFGRVVEEIKIHDFLKAKSRLVHFFQVIKLFITMKYKDAQVDIMYQGESMVLNTDEEGFFYGVIHKKLLESPPEDKVTFRIHSLSENNDKFQNSRLFNSKVIRPTAKTKRIIVSDIDDTVMKSKATNFTRMAFRTLFSTVSHRKTFPEAARTYEKLKFGENRNEENLFFYVSSSTWNIYPLLEGFLKINNFPEGIILLQDVAGERLKVHKISHGHKLDRISEILEFYQDLNLILIGDAGQQDAEIYLQIAEAYPSRIERILIRKTWWSEVMDNNKHYCDRAATCGTEMQYFDKLDKIYSFQPESSN